MFASLFDVTQIQNQIIREDQRVRHLTGLTLAEQALRCLQEQRGKRITRQRQLSRVIPKSRVILKRIVPSINQLGVRRKWEAGDRASPRHIKSFVFLVEWCIEKREKKKRTIFVCMILGDFILIFYKQREKACYIYFFDSVLVLNTENTELLFFLILIFIYINYLFIK